MKVDDIIRVNFKHINISVKLLLKGVVEIAHEFHPAEAPLGGLYFLDVLLPACHLGAPVVQAWVLGET